MALSHSSRFGPPALCAIEQGFQSRLADRSMSVELVRSLQNVIGREERLPILSVTLDGEQPTMRTVHPRTTTIKSGVLCEIWVDERMQLCVVDSVGDDGSITARRLPGPSSSRHVTDGGRAEIGRASCRERVEM